jgi:hypothetical protein
MTRNDVFDEIVWRERPEVKEPQLWARNVHAVQLLCSLARVKTRRTENSGETYYMPYIYELDGVEIRFLPVWGYYTVGGLILEVPTSEVDIRKAVEAVKTLQALGLKITPS